MERSQEILPFPEEVPMLDPKQVIGAFVEARGRFSAVGSSEFRPQSSASIMLLMTGSREAIRDICSLSIPCVPIEEDRFGERQDRPWKDVGREIGWMRKMGVDGRLMADEVYPVPFRTLFLDLTLPADAFFVRGKLERAIIQLPPEIQAPSLSHYFISGMSLRAVDTFPNRPGGGTRVAV